MILPENLCKFCAGDLDAYVFYHNIKDLIVIQKLELLVNDDAKICSYCFVTINKIQKFWEQSIKIQDFFSYINTVNLDENKLNEIKREFDIIQRNDQCTDTYDLCKNEINEFSMEEKTSINDCEDINDDHTFTELDDFAEIPTNFVIESITETEHSEVADEIEISYNTTVDDKSTNQIELKSNTELNYICHLCNEEFKNFFGLYSHVRKIHDSIPQVLCHCGDILQSRVQINSHKKLHSLENSFKCHLCDKVYSHHQSLQNHLKKSHAEQEGKIFMCNRCQRVFDSERKLKLHQQVHKTDEEKLIYPCPECDRKFTKSVNVQAHIKSVHEKERPFLCSNCGKSFSTKGALKEHLIVHSSSFPFACKFCPKKFKNLPRLKTHEDIHSTTQYICNVCGISLNTKRTLKMHLVIHSDEKRFKCEYCQTSFKRSKALKNHLILHSGLRPYSCPFCDKTFANGSNCRSHKKKAHPVELADFEASGKKLSTPSIPRLEQLMTKTSDQLVLLDTPNMLLQDVSTSNIKLENSTTMIIQSTESF